MTDDRATVCKLSIVAFQSKLSKEEIEGMGCRVWTINSMTHKQAWNIDRYLKEFLQSPTVMCAVSFLLSEGWCVVYILFLILYFTHAPFQDIEF